MSKQWVYVEFHNAEGEEIGHYWLNHFEPIERACLGMRCADTFAEGGSVFTARVSANGEVP